MDPTDREAACFEAGVKFGSLYHQFAGTPVSPESADSLARAMEEAIENQPYCADVSVDVLTDELVADHEFGYTELTGEHLAVEMQIEYDDVVVHTEMAMDEGYPLMQVVDVHENGDR